MATTTQDQEPENPCAIFKDYPSDASSKEKVSWLQKKFPLSVDEKYFKCILESHIATEEDFKKGISDFISDNNNLITNTFSFDYIKSLYEEESVNYDNFISFEVDKSTNRITVSLTKEFLTDKNDKKAPVSYSIPLLESIYSAFGKVDLVFAKTSNGTSEDILFFTKGNSNFFDYSEEPK